METTTVEDAYGNKVETEVGIDGENPVSPQNPPAKSQAYISEDAYMSTRGEGGTPTGDPAEEPSESDDEDKAPAKSAPKGDWVDYAVKQGADREEAEESTKDDLIATYGD